MSSLGIDFAGQRSKVSSRRGIMANHGWSRLFPVLSRNFDASRFFLTPLSYWIHDRRQFTRVGIFLFLSLFDVRPRHTREAGSKHQHPTLHFLIVNILAWHPCTSIPRTGSAFSQRHVLQTSKHRSIEVTARSRQTTVTSLSSDVARHSHAILHMLTRLRVYLGRSVDRELAKILSMERPEHSRNRR